MWLSDCGSRAMKPPGGECHDLFGAEFKGSPCHLRVLKPPGGGSSDIFGAADPVQNSPRRVRNNLQSSVFGPPAPATTNSENPVRSKPGNDSYNRLFGPTESRPSSASKDRLKSNIVLSEETGNSPTESKNSDLNSSTSSEVDSKDGNPVTGEGYSQANGEKEAAPVTNGTAHSATPQRTRVPPGGYSSGLW